MCKSMSKTVKKYRKSLCEKCGINCEKVWIELKMMIKCGKVEKFAGDLQNHLHIDFKEILSVLLRFSKFSTELITTTIIYL